MAYVDKVGGLGAGILSGNILNGGGGSLREQLAPELQRVKYYQRQKQFDQALKIVDGVLEKDTAYAEALYIKAVILWEGFGDSTAAKECLGRIMAMESVESEMFRPWAASLYDELGKMTACPACHRDVQEGQQECPRCGVVFAKWKGRSPSPATSPAVRPSRELQPLINRLVLALLAVTAALALYPTIKATVEHQNDAPDFQLTTLEGESFNKGSLKGQPALLIYWAPWCGVCRSELPILAQFYRRDKPANLRVLAVGFFDTRDHVVQYVNDNPGTFVFPTAYDTDDRTAHAFGLRYTPTYLLLDAQGRVLVKHEGNQMLESPQFQQFLAGLKGS